MAPRTDRAERLLDLVSFFLAEGRAVSWKEIQDAFPADYAEGSKDACLRKFERDKAELLELGVPLEFVPGLAGAPGAYQVSAEQYYLRDLRLAPEELTLLSMAGAAALQQPDFPFRADLAHALDKLLFERRGNGAGAARLVLHLPAAGAERRAAVLEALGRAVATRKNVSLRYRSFHGEITERTVSPWGLAYRRGAWFVVGHCHLRGGLRSFQAERILELSLNAQKPRTPDFEVPADFDVTAWVGREPWQFQNHAEVEVELRLGPGAALLASSRFGAGAIIERLPDGGVAVRLGATNGEALVREALRLTPYAELIGPARLRERVGAAAARIAELHVGEPRGVSAAVLSDDEVPPSAPTGEVPTVEGLPSGGALELQERLRRALFLIPWAVRNRGCTVEELAEAARIAPEEVIAEIDFLRMIGKPPFSPADLVDLDVIDGRVEICLPQGLLRPPSLTPLEAAALDAAASALDGVGGEALGRVREKLRAALPPLARGQFDAVAGRVKMASMGLQPEVAAAVDRAVAERRELSFTYWTAGRGEASRRTVRPLERVLHQGYWYLHAFCLERRDRRLFRLDRAVDFEVSEKTFVPRTVDDAARFRRESLYAPGERARACTLRLAPGPLATPEVARRLGATSIGRAEDGALLATVPVDGAAYVVSLVLSLGGEGELLEPADLRERVREAASALALAHR